MSALADVEATLRESGEFFDRYVRAAAARKRGDLNAAVALLLPSVAPPSEYHGHYRELFLAFRQITKGDLASGRFLDVIARVRNMVHWDREMLEIMTEKCSAAAGRPVDCSSYSKLRLADAKALLRAAEAVDDQVAKREALALLKAFPVSVR